MKLHTLHRTRYRYEAPVRESFNEARLRPATADGQECRHFELRITPSARSSHYLDFYQNCVHLFEIAAPHSELVVEATALVFTRDAPALPADATPAPLARVGDCLLQDRCYDFLPDSTYVEVTPETTALAVAAAGGATDVWQAAQAIMRHIHGEFHYRPASTTVHTHMREVLKARHGVCQDFAHVMIGFCRALKIPARYVSGYLYNGPRDELKGAQASHAWTEVFIDGAGWCGLDPTNAQLAAHRHVKVAVGRDYADVSPLKGTYRGTDKHRLSVEVLVSEIEEMPQPLPVA
ncbi:MAG: transglutaminase family protein [Candidatus Didemnitutus sp.]|nr:transglutaminase family protein [Candidatus Didemnitutus sp.]